MLLFLLKSEKRQISEYLFI